MDEKNMRVVDLIPTLSLRSGLGMVEVNFGSKSHFNGKEGHRGHFYFALTI